MLISSAFFQNAEKSLSDALARRCATAKNLLDTFQSQLNADIQAGKVTEPPPPHGSTRVDASGDGETSTRKKSPIMWRPSLKSKLFESVHAELAASELQAALAMLRDKGAVEPLDAARMEQLRMDARDAVCERVLAFWPKGWMTIQKVRSAYNSAWKRQLDNAQKEAGGTTGM